MDREIPPADQRPITPMTYLTEIVATSWRHGGELALAVGSIALVALAALVTRAQLHLEAFGGWDVLFVLLLLIGAGMLFVGTMAGWRLYRKQRIELATTRDRYRRREARSEMRHTARIDLLRREIAVLQTERVPRHPPGLEVELNRADDDGWPPQPVPAR